MIVAVDFTIVNTVMSEIQVGLKVNVSALQWIMTAYGIPLSVLFTIGGRLGDLYGRRLLLYISMGGFLIGSIGAGLAQDIWTLVISRCIQGIFGAAIFPCGSAIASAIFPKEMQGRALSIYFAMLGIGLAIGPVLGGLIISYLDWHWIFLMNIPIILVSYALCLPVLQESKNPEKISLDYKGVLLFIIGLGAFIFAITEMPNFGFFSPAIIIALGIALIFLIVFFQSERKASNPVLPLKLFHNRGFFLGVMNVIASISCCWVVIFLVPLYMQNILNYSPGETGLLLLSMTLMTCIFPPVGGLILDKRGPVLATFLLFGVILLSYILYLFFTQQRDLWLMIPGFILFGIGWGLGNGIGPTLALSHLPSGKDVGLVSGTLTTILNVTAVIFLAIIGAIFHFAEKEHLKYLLSNQDLNISTDKIALIRSLLSNPDKAKNLLDNLKDSKQIILALFQQSFMFGFRIAIVALIVVCFGSFIALVKPLLRKSQ